jgi:hypothetical protein
MRIPAITLSIAGALALAAAPAFAEGQESTRLMPHVVPMTDLVGMHEACAGIQPFECEKATRTFRTEAGLSTTETPYFTIYVVATDYDPGPGLTGVQFGITYAPAAGVGVDLIDWVGCTDSQFSLDGWPASGTGVRSVWDRQSACQRRGWSVVGYFIVTARSEDVFALVPWPNSRTLEVVDCAATTSILPPEQAGAIGFGGAAGSDPCYENGSTTLKVVPTVATTWGAVKTLYAR